MSRIRRHEAKVALTFILVSTLTAALTAGIPGGAAHARAALDFGFDPGTPRPSDVLALVLTNSKAVALPTLAAIVAGRTIGRRYGDLLLAATLAPNAIHIGIAFGAYGPRLAPWTPHLPLEILGMAIAAGAYLRTDPHASTAQPRVARASLVLAVLTAAALVETYCTPVRP